MKSAGIILLLLVFLLSFSLADHLFRTLYDYYTDNIASQPVLVLAYGSEQFRDAEQYLKSQDALSFISSEINVQVLEKMARRYGLAGIEDVVELSTLPNVIHLKPAIENIELKSLDAAIENIREIIKPRGSILYSHEDIALNLSHRHRLSLFHLLFRAGTSIFLFLLVFYLSKSYLIESEPLWNILMNICQQGNRYLHFLKNSIYSFYLPFIAAILSVYAVRLFIADDYYFDIRIWTIKLVLIISANQIAWLTHKS